MNKFLLITTALSITTLAVTLHQPMQAQTLPPATKTFPPAPRNCVYLREVKTSQSFIRKVIARRNSNANTDFAVPTGTAFTSYIGKLIPENNEKYSVQINLKYNNGSSSQVVNRTIQAQRFFLYDQPFRTPTGNQPFQINARVMGNPNTAYQIAILACS